MELKDIEQLLHTFEESSAMSLDWTEGEFQIHLSKRETGDTIVTSDTSQPVAPPATPEGPEPTPAEGTHDAPEQQREETTPDTAKAVTSPMVGIVYMAPSPDEPNYKSVGDKVEVGDVLCVIEAMKMFTEVKSDVAGTLSEVVVSDGDMVEYDQPLFKISEAEA